MLKVDFHTHTNYLQPKEGTNTPKILIDEAVLRGYDALCITEHYIPFSLNPDYRKNPLKTYNDFKGYAKKKGLLLLPGVEFRFKEGEVLLVNFNGDVRKIKTIGDIAKLPKSVLRIAPHPFFKRGICLGRHLVKNISLFDAIEYSYYYLHFFNLNRKAVAVSRQYSKPMVGNSDSHDLDYFGFTFSRVDAEKNAMSIVNAVRNGKVKVDSRPLPPLLFLNLTLITMPKATFYYYLYSFMGMMRKLFGRA